PGEIAKLISRRLVQLYSRRLGRGPTKARVVANTNVITVIFEDALTKSEHTLQEAGLSETVVETRQSLAKAIQRDASEIIESLTNRGVAAHVSGVDVEANVSVAVFVLEPVEETGEVGIAEADPEDSAA
ncbi:MAG: Na-translocating system protein MpsC family protein, partial [Solirubrobacterales bacterium]